MITVRFPNGQAVKYNDGYYVETETNQRRIYNKGGGTLLAFVPLDCIIEWVTPCAVHNPLDKEEITIKYDLEALKKEIKLLRKELKKGGY
jgi:hypothetical protein